MSRIVSIHSFRGGTGKSNATANISALLAMEGFRVGVVDTDIQSPGIHVLFGLDIGDMKYSLNDFLWGKCDINEAVYAIDSGIETLLDGSIFLIPSSVKAGDIARVLRYGYDVSLLREGFLRLIKELELDALMIDTHPGLNEETLLSIAVSDILVVILRPDQQDYQGTGITIEVARQLDVPRMLLVVNKVPASFDSDEIRSRMVETYKCDVAGVLPHSDDMMILGSSGIFALHYPNHPVTDTFREIARILLG